MSWTAPMTAVDNEPFSAAEYEQYIRQNLLVQAPEQVTAANQIPVVVGPNEIATVTPDATHRGNIANTGDPIIVTATSYVSLGVSLTVEAYDTVQVNLKCLMRTSTGDNTRRMSVGVSGASTVPPDDSFSLVVGGPSSGNMSILTSSLRTMSGLTPGENTFTLYGKVDTGSASFQYANVGIIPL
jgi:hypothetical protein